VKSGLRVGHSAELHWEVDPSRAIALGGGRVTVFSTPAMIGLMEYAARAGLEPFLEPDEESVGMEVSVRHVAATPLGATVRGVATVTRVEGRVIDFDVTAHDAGESIGQGTHRRAVIDVEKFANRLVEQKGAAIMTAAATPIVSEPVLKPNPGDLPPMTTITFSGRDGVGTLALNRPTLLNAMNPQMTTELRAVVDWLAGHAEQVRVAVLTGAGRAFCAGDDLKAIAALPPDEADRWNVRQAELLMAFQRLPQATIAAINGPCFGGGLVLASSCDLRLASRSATFGMPEAKLGWVPSFGIPQLAAVAGKAAALELCLRCRTISSERALAMGLVHEIAPPAMLARAVDAAAKDLLSLAPTALRETRQLVHHILPDASSFTETQTQSAYGRCIRTADAREGLAAFEQKRGARFTGR
jgi:enoyl-CoA hydratase/carnithine racemase/predicted thioesterase